MTDEYESEPGDAEAMAAVRAGDTGAFDVLYRRHVTAARRLARVMARDPSDVDDLVAEAFARLLGVLSAGRGPETAFRPYLFATMRHLFYERTRQEKRLQVTDDMTRYEPGVPFVDTAVDSLEMSLVSKAFASLPERWQTVLWHTEVERERPSKVAPLLGLTPNGVAALAYRAREGLRQQYLQEHIAAEPADECRWAIERLGAYVRGGLARRDTAKIDAHLEVCRRCHVLFVELGEVSARMRDLLAPSLVSAGYFATAGKLAWLAPVVEPVKKAVKRRDTQVVGGVVAVAVLAALALLLTSQPAAPPPGSPPQAAVPVPPPPQPPAVAPTPVPPATPSPGPVPTTRAPESAAILEASLEPVGALVRGRPGTLVMTVAHRGVSSVAFGPRAFRMQRAPDTGPLTALLTLPPGVAVRAGNAGDGWQCSGTTCTRGSLTAGQSTRAYLPVDVSGSAEDGELSVRLTAPRATARSTTRLGDIQVGGLAATFAATTRASVITGGNRLMSCAALPLLGCLGLGVDNGDFYMTKYSDPAAPAGAPHGAAVSGADIPVRGQVVWAGLYWSGSGKPPASPAAHVRVPGTDRYTPVRAGRVDRLDGAYQAFANVTDVVRGTGGGRWWVAVEHAFEAGVGSYGGWALVLVVGDGVLRHVAVIDGFQAVKAGSVSTPVYGMPGARAAVAFVGWEGDRGITGDRLRLGDRALGGDNVASSTADGTPAGWNTFGVDARLFDTRMPTGSVQPDVTATSTGDAWFFGVLAIASEASPG